MKELQYLLHELRCDINYCKVSDEFKRRFEGANMTDGSIKYQNQIVMVYPDNNIYGWVASPSDVLEQDWIIMD